MIKTLKVRNFESWKEADLEFHEGVNVIVGESDEGKSGLIRAIRLNTLNKPKGFPYRSDFLSDNKDMTSVELSFDSDDKILRQRNLSGTNEYRINNGEPLVALRTNVPTEISDITKISSINIQGQHPTEQYFLLSERSGYVAKEFNKVSGLSIMDDAMADINSQVRSAKSKFNVYQEDLKEKQIQLKKDEWILSAKKEADSLKSLELQIQDIQNDQNEIQQIIDTLKEHKKKLIKYKPVPKAIKALKTLFSYETEKEQITNQIDSLNSAINRIEKMTLEVNAMSDISQALKTINSVQKLEEEQKEIDENIQVLNDLVQRIEQSDSNYKKAEEEFQEIDKIFHETIKTEECPVCGRKN